jgi:hypothetical protein
MLLQGNEQVHVVGALGLHPQAQAAWPVISVSWAKRCSNTALPVCAS